MANPQPLLAGRTPLFTVRQAEEINNQYNLWTPKEVPIQYKPPGGKTLSITPLACCAYSSVATLDCTDAYYIAPFFNFVETTSCNPAGADSLLALSDIGGGGQSPAVWTTAFERAMLDTYYAALQSGIDDTSFIAIAPQIEAQARDYFPVRQDFEFLHQVAPGPPWTPLWQNDPRAQKAFNAVFWAGYRHIIGGQSAAPLLAWASQEVSQTGFLGTGYLARWLSGIATITSLYPDNNKLMVLDGYPWSPKDAITKHIATLMYDPVYAEQQSMSQQTTQGTGTTSTTQTGQTTMISWLPLAAIALVSILIWGRE